MIQSDWLQRYHDAKHALGPVIGRLERLSMAFHTVGNPTVADELFAMAEDLIAIRKQIDEAVGDNIHENFRQTQAGVGLMLQACLAGVIGPRGEENDG